MQRDALGAPAISSKTNNAHDYADDENRCDVINASSGDVEQSYLWQNKHEGMLPPYEGLAE